MANDTERLFISLEARIADFEKRMKQAEKRGTRTYDKLERGSRSATRNMERDMARSTGRVNAALATTQARIGATTAAFRGLAAGAAVAITGAAVRQMTLMARSIAEIGDQAERAGVSAAAFQEWKFVAEQNRIGVDAMTDALREMNLRADEFVVTGKGPAAEAFERLGIGADELQERLKDPSELMLTIIGRLGELDRAAQIRIADEIFGGTGGERFVELLDQGEQGIRDTIDRARELGVVMDEEMIAKADEVDRRFNEIANTVGFKLKSAIVSAADSLAGFIDKFRSFEDQRDRSLQTRVNSIIRDRGDIAAEIKELEGQLEGSWRRGALESRIDQLRAQMERLSAEENRIIEILSDRNPPAPSDSGPDVWTPPELPGRDDGDGAGGGRGARTRAVGRERDAVAALIAELMRENALIGKSAAERAKINALREAGADATAEERAAIEELIDANIRKQAAVERSEARMETLGQTGRDVLNGLVGDLRRGESGADALASALGRLADRLISLSLETAFDTLVGAVLRPGMTAAPSRSPLSGLSGQKLLPPFAMGGYTGAGGRNDPAGIVHAGEYVIRASEVRKPGMLSMLQAINSGLPGFANGGRVPGCEGRSEIIIGRNSS
jgi:hypothetical protein